MILKMSSPSQSQACRNHQNYNFRVYLLRPKQFFLGKKKTMSADVMETKNQRQQVLCEY